MKRRRGVSLPLLSLAATALSCGEGPARLSPVSGGGEPGGPVAPASAPASQKAKGPDITGPFVYENLTIFFIHGEDQIKGKTFLTLEEALAQKKLVVYETSEVNELEVENVSATEEVFIQAGEIVKGGKQDRVLSQDLIIPAKSGKMPIASFCVEQGRWSGREGEATDAFSASSKALATKDLKIAVRKKKEQGEVWKEVANAQDKLKSNVGVEVKSGVSETSLQLTLENEQVEKAAEAYVKALAAKAQLRPDVIGYAFAINGKLNSVDIYASAGLFQKLWPKLIRASAVEAVAEKKPGEAFGAVSVADLRAYLAEAEKAAPVEKEVSERATEVTQESEKTVKYELRDKKAKAPVRKNYLTK
jgi:hypothetical protein